LKTIVPEISVSIVRVDVVNDHTSLTYKHIHRVFQEEKSIFWEVIVSVILNKKLYIYTYVLFRTASEIEIFHCIVPDLFIRKRYYVLFLIPVFIVQVTKLIQFI
jgi:hypothetical protein